jgi:hypothetical protein
LTAFSELVLADPPDAFRQFTVVVASKVREGRFTIGASQKTELDQKLPIVLLYQPLFGDSYDYLSSR